MPRANATNGMSPNLTFTSGVTPPGLPMSIEAASRTRPEPQNRPGWNQPFSRNKQAFGGSPSCTALGSLKHLDRTLPSDIASVSAQVRLIYEWVNLETRPSQSSRHEKVFESSLRTERS